MSHQDIPNYNPDGSINYPNVAAKVLASCKTIDKYFPNPEVNPVTGKTTADAWAMIFSKRPDYPPALWYAAVLSFYGSEDAAEGAKPGVQDIVRHARIQADKEPFKSELRAIRARRVEERDQVLALGRAKQAALPKPSPVADLDSVASFSSAAKEVITRARMQYGKEGSF